MGEDKGIRRGVTTDRAGTPTVHAATLAGHAEDVVAPETVVPPPPPPPPPGGPPPGGWACRRDELVRDWKGCSRPTTTLTAARVLSEIKMPIALIIGSIGMTQDGCSCVSLLQQK